MHKESITYSHEGTTLVAHFVFDDTIQGIRPAVLVAHAWRGQDQFARDKAEAIAKLGYVGFALDIYGDAKSVTTTEEAKALMQPFFHDRKLLQERMKAAFTCVKKLQMVDPKKIGGIGFCFGGLAILELFRSGVDLRGACTFHAVLGNEGAKTVPIQPGIQGSILLLHGANDPLVSQADVQAMQEDLTQAGVDWEMDIYSHTSHAFTVPTANDPSMGLKYNPKAEWRSWQAMTRFFKEIF